jgi:hypothetical protein
MSFHHKSIRKFSIEGEILDDSLIARLKDEYTRLLVSQMRIANHVPRIDIEPDVTIKYNSKRKIFTFKITIYGVNVGRENIECIKAVDKTVPIYIQKSKLKELSQAVE